jgi:hypothetical protein
MSEVDLWDCIVWAFRLGCVWEADRSGSPSCGRRLRFVGSALAAALVRAPLTRASLRERAPSRRSDPSEPRLARGDPSGSGEIAEGRAGFADSGNIGVSGCFGRGTWDNGQERVGDSDEVAGDDEVARDRASGEVRASWGRGRQRQLQQYSCLRRR